MAPVTDNNWCLKKRPSNNGDIKDIAVPRNIPGSITRGQIIVTKKQCDYCETLKVTQPVNTITKSTSHPSGRYCFQKW